MRTLDSTNLQTGCPITSVLLTNAAVPKISSRSAVSKDCWKNRSYVAIILHQIMQFFFRIFGNLGNSNSSRESCFGMRCRRSRVPHSVLLCQKLDISSLVSTVFQAAKIQISFYSLKMNRYLLE